MLVPPPLGQQEKLRAHELEEGVGDAVGIAGIPQVLPHQSGQREAVGEVAQEEGPGIGAQALGARLDLDGPVEIRRKECTLNFTHSVFAGSVMKMLFRHLHLIAGPADALWAFCCPARHSQSAW